MLTFATSQNLFAGLSASALGAAAYCLLEAWRADLDDEYHPVLKVIETQDSSVLEDPEGVLHQRAVAFLAFIPELVRSNRAFEYDGIWSVPTNPQRLHDIYGPKWLRERPAQAWIYDRIGEGEAYYPRLFSKCSYGDVRPIFDPAYRMATVCRKPGILNAALVAAGIPVAVTSGEVTIVVGDKGDVSGYLITDETKARIAGPDWFSEKPYGFRDTELSVIRSIRAAGYDVDETSTITRQDGRVMISVPTGLSSIRIVDETLPEIVVAIQHEETGFGGEARMLVRSLNADNVRWSCLIQTQVCGEEIVMRLCGYRSPRGPGGAIYRPDPEAYFTVADHKLNEHRNQLPVFRDADGSPHPRLQEIRSTLLKKMHDPLYAALEHRFAAQP